MGHYEFRTGIGYDFHRLKKGVPLFLGGIQIPYEKGLEGHSDGDALLHALVDALLGAGALGDIGTYFSDQNPKWKGKASRHFVKAATSKIEKKRFEISFVDCIILAEKPKLQPYFGIMAKNIASLLKISKENVSVKAKTHEKTGAIGKGNAMAAFVAITLKLLH